MLFCGKNWPFEKCHSSLKTVSELSTKQILNNRKKFLSFFKNLNMFISYKHTFFVNDQIYAFMTGWSLTVSLAPLTAPNLPVA